MALSEEVYLRIKRRMEAGKIPIFPQLIRQKAITRYKAENQAELRRRQAVARAKIATERKARARREAAERSAIYEARETRRKKVEARAEALKDVRACSWVKIAPDGSASIAGEAASVSPYPTRKSSERALRTSPESRKANKEENRDGQ
jgi:hypothetical protein